MVFTGATGYHTITDTGYYITYDTPIYNTSSVNELWNDIRITWDGEKYILVCVDKPEKPKKEFNMELKIND